MQMQEQIMKRPPEAAVAERDVGSQCWRCQGGGSFATQAKPHPQSAL